MDCMGFFGIGRRYLVDPRMTTNMVCEAGKLMGGIAWGIGLMRANILGRAWTPAELRAKSWEDLHKLWWICCKERNILATQRIERGRLDAGFGDFEAKQREKQVRWTQRGIKHVLTERWHGWREALKLAEEDEEVNLSGEGPALKVLEEEEFVEEGDVEGERVMAEGEDVIKEVSREEVEREVKELVKEQAVKEELLKEQQPKDKIVL